MILSHSFPCTQAKYLSTAMMFVILLSIVSFTIASNPSYIWYTDVWVDNLTLAPIPGSTWSTPASPSDGVPGAHINSSPRRVSTELEEGRTPFFQIEVFCNIVFTIEYFSRLVASPQGPGVVRYILGLSNIIDLVSILPFYIELVMSALQADGGGALASLSVLRLIRLTRITRIFKMSKNFEGLIMLLRSLRKSLPALLMLFSFMTIAGILFATLIYNAEIGTYDAYRHQYVRPDGSPSPFESIPGSLWWTIVTMTTVGYGDQYPVTTSGKIIAVVTMFCGLVLLSLPITIIGANFDDEYRELRKRAQEAKERERLKERAERARRSQQQQQQQAASDAKLATPERRSSEAGGADADGAALTFPPSSPSPFGDGVGEDPIKLIQALIHEAHYNLVQDVEKLMLDHENKLRGQIKGILKTYTSGADVRSTPLDQAH